MKNFYKNITKIGIVFSLIIIFTYVCAITLLPNNIILTRGQILDFKTIFGLSITNANENASAMQTSNNLNKKEVNQSGSLKVNLSLFGRIPVKDMKVEVIQKTTVIPIGKAVGMKLYTDGVLVVGMSEIEGKKPYENSGIQEGDKIIEIDNQKINNTNDLIEKVNKSNGKKIKVIYKREEETITTSIEPVKTKDAEYKIGLWVRDSAAGIGTMTFYEPSSGMFAALGHGITDIDTSELISIASGELVTTSIRSVIKGEKGTPGEMRGIIDKSILLGSISKNTDFGIYGKITNFNKINLNQSSEMEVALREEVKASKAQILCQLDNNKIESYDVQIQKIYSNNYKNNKSMLIKIIDDKLLEKAGGIIQGMSGAPIIQNGKFIGAITHVLVNEPTEGYAVFADMMIKQLQKAQ